MLPDFFSFSLPAKVVYGVGIVNSLSSEISFLGPRRAILVTDKILSKTTAVKQALESLKPTTIDVVYRFDRVPPNATVSTVKSCARMARKHDCDLFLAIGGGSVLDTAKVANLLAVKGGRLASHMGAYLMDKAEQLHPSIFVPTTAGTGSEVTKVAVIMDPANNAKLPFTEDQFLPTLAVLDPALTATMPGKLTAATGMDALTHAIEAYVDLENAPPSDALALHAIKLISAHILRACAHPDDLQARGAMLTGSFLAGLAFSHSMVGMTHGIAHALGGVYNIPHGLANALVLPEVMTYNLDTCLERYADVAVAMGVSYPQVVADGQRLLESGGRELITPFLPPIGPVHSWVDRQSNRVRRLASQTLDNFKFVDQWVRKQTAKAGIDRIRLFNRQLAHLTGMPLDLRSAGINDNLAKLEQVVTKAMEDGAMLYNPVEPDRLAVRDIIKKLYRTGIRPLPVSEAEITKAAAGHRQGQRA
jgi:alcohol dehydrogenase class IV